jgi:hypothetical protein
MQRYIRIVLPLRQCLELVDELAHMLLMENS